MSTEPLAARQKALMIGVMLVVLAAVIVTGLLLREHGPGNMGLGMLQGAAVGTAAGAVMLWRVTKRRARTTTFERAWTQTGDERDDAVLTRALAVLGLLAFPMTAVAALAIGFGAEVEMVVALLLFGELAVGGAAFGVLNRRL